MTKFPTRNGASVPTTAPTADTPTVNTDLPAGHDDETSEFYVPPEARPGYRVDADEEMLAFAGEMNRPAVMGWLPGPLRIARQRVYDDAYPAARERALARGENPRRWPAPDQATPDERRKLCGIDPLGTGVPSKPDAESTAVWLHRRRVDRARRQDAAVRDEIARRAAYDRSHTCALCGQMLVDVGVRPVLRVNVQTCGCCEVILTAGLVAVLSREPVGENRNRGQAVSQWLAGNADRWAGLQLPAARDAWSSPTRPAAMIGQPRGALPTPPPPIPAGGSPL